MARLCSGVRQDCVVEMGLNRSGLPVAVFKEPRNSSQPESGVILSFQSAERD